MQLKENGLFKYILYALGEIVLVVIGILIALQINNVKESNERRQEELVHLKNILFDLQNDKVGLLKIIDRIKDKEKSANIMVDYYNGNRIKISDYYFHLTNVLYWEAYHPQNVSVDELINSGKLSIIGNEEIKRLLLNIRSAYFDASIIEGHMYNDHTNFLYLKFGNIIDYNSVFKAYFNPKTEIKLSEEDIKSTLNDKAVKNGFALAGLGYEGLDIELNEILTKENKVIDLIQIEIDKN